MIFDLVFTILVFIKVICEYKRILIVFKQFGLPDHRSHFKNQQTRRWTKYPGLLTQDSKVAWQDQEGDGEPESAAI